MPIKSTLQNIAIKALGLSGLVQMWEAGQVTETKKTQANKPYAQVEMVFACVNRLIQGVMGMPPVLSTANEQIIESGNEYELLFQKQSWSSLVTQAIGHWALSRDVFFIFPGDTAEFVIVSGTQMHPVTHDGTNNGELVGWEFRSGKNRIKLSLKQVHQWKNFNPYDRYHGIGPATACRYSIDYSYAAQLFNSSALDNGADPGIILMPQSKLSADEIRTLRSQFDSRHKGAANAKRTAVLTGMADVKSIAYSMVDMQMAEMVNMTDKKIAVSFDVPPELVGLATESQYSHGPAQRDFIFNTIIPLCSQFACEITTGILSRTKTDPQARMTAIKKAVPSRLTGRRLYKDARQKAAQTGSQIFLWFDTQQHPTVQDAMRENTEKILTFADKGIPLNELINTHDLPYNTDNIPWGNDWWVSAGLIPARELLDNPYQSAGPSLPEGQGTEDDVTDGERYYYSNAKKQILDIAAAESVTAALPEERQTPDDPKKLRLWRNWVMSWAGIERRYRSAIRSYFNRQQRNLIKRLKDTWQIYGDKSVSAKADKLNIIANVVFDLEEENGRLKVINNTFFQQAAELGIRQSLTEAGTEDINTLAGRTLQSPRLKSKRIISNTKISNVNKTTRTQIINSLSEGIDSGDSLDALVARIEGRLKNNRARALKIARTQTAGAVSSGRHEGMKSANVKLKSWLTSRDEAVRPSHKDAEDRYKDGIPLDEPFVIGGAFLMHPADPRGPASEIINCRCVELSVKPKKDYYDSGFKFYSLIDMETQEK